MRFAADLLAELRLALHGHPVPRVRALHLPPLAAAESRSGEFCAIELDDGALGMSFVLLDESLQQLTAAEGMRARLAGMDALQLAEGFSSEGEGESEGPDFIAPALRRTLGFAAANALSRSVMNRIGFTPPPARDSIAGIDPQAGDHIGMIGLFTPLLNQITAAGARLTVIELRSEWAGDFDGYRVTTDASALLDCNKVLSTSTVLLNHSIDHMLQHCRNAGHIALIGPGAGCLPDPLFARGISVIGGSWITDPAAFIAALQHGDSWSAFACKFAMRATDWPGLPRP